MSRSPWSYTFRDMLTGEELAVLPLTQVKYTRAIAGGGTLDAYLHLGEDRIRALDPWRATKTRRTVVYVDYTDPETRQPLTVWGGPVLRRAFASDSEGLVLSCGTWESWLFRQRLLYDLTAPTVPVVELVRQLVVQAQTTTNVGLAVDTSNLAGSPIVSAYYSAQEVKPVLQLLEAIPVDTGQDVEFRVEVSRNPDTGQHRKIVRVGVPRLGRRFERSGLRFAYPTGSLLSWKLDEDGSGADNVMPVLGSGSGPLQPFDIVYDRDAGVDELASGYPSWMRDGRYQDTDDIGQVRARGRADLRGGIASESVYSGVKVDAAAYLGRADPGDDVALEITKRTLREWPKPATAITRILGETVTVGDGGKGDTVELTVGGVPGLAA